MHPSQVVTDDVFAQRVEVVALLAEHVQVGYGAVRVAVAAARHGEAVDGRIDGEFEHGSGVGRLEGEAERIADFQPEAGRRR